MEQSVLCRVFERFVRSGAIIRRRLLQYIAYPLVRRSKALRLRQCFECAHGIKPRWEVVDRVRVGVNDGRDFVRRVTQLAQIPAQAIIEKLKKLRRRLLRHTTGDVGDGSEPGHSDVRGTRGIHLRFDFLCPRLLWDVRFMPTNGYLYTAGQT